MGQAIKLNCFDFTWVRKGLKKLTTLKQVTKLKHWQSLLAQVGALGTTVHWINNIAVFWTHRLFSRDVIHSHILVSQDNDTAGGHVFVSNQSWTWVGVQLFSFINTSFWSKHFHGCWTREEWKLAISHKNCYIDHMVKTNLQCWKSQRLSRL